MTALWLEAVRLATPERRYAAIAAALVWVVVWAAWGIPRLLRLFRSPR